MILLFGIIFSLLFAAATIKKGLYTGWARLVNIVLSIYLSVFLTPTIARCCNAVTDARYGYALCMTITAVAAFLILQGFTTTFFTGTFKISFPKILNITGSAILGFICGLLIWSFACFVFLLTPVPHGTIGQRFEVPSQLVRASVPPLRLTCGFVNICSFQGKKANASKVLDSLLYVEEEVPVDDESSIEDELPDETNEADCDDQQLLNTCKQYNF
jgi:hypothetical protein